MKLQKAQAFTLIELLVVISIIAILAGIALPVFGEVKIRGDQTKALSNAKQIGTACKIYATDNNGIYPHFSNYVSASTAAATNTEAKEGDSSNVVLRNLIPDYLPDRGIFVNAKSAFTKKSGAAAVNGDDPLPADTNQWAYVTGLTDTSNSRWPLLADGFTPDSATGGDPSYSLLETDAGGVWRGKKAVVIRVDGSGTVETLLTGKRTVKRTDDDNQNAFKADSSASTTNTGKIQWFTANSGVYVLNPIKPAAN